jgi:acetoacetyl-CoA synthetase
MLGMAIEAFSQEGKPVPPGEAGELVCLQPFPCQPIGFWPLPGFGSDAAVGEARKRYRQSYLEAFENVWCKLYISLVVKWSINGSKLDHGDHVIISKSQAGNGGGLIMLGRSDGVL